MKKSGFLVFAVGVVLGFCLVQGLAYAQNNYIWAIFYK